ncbi:MAG: hypothetical protein A3I61_10320 [Acidobacteria bacterium RIFCSPLOWO2_02_FULL_68_18]|nr:MAG: hypothetical protein A3I61_10320 [Acidobacteria bacterium RIFCSPLOWO2_02_FULL_68_18]OFW48646.1 MAG: hypothetical protein A3G77_14155 [Acidobacteria bacterium RIFCSPLOWO2_12_FULL_68_19]
MSPSVNTVPPMPSSSRAVASEFRSHMAMSPAPTNVCKPAGSTGVGIVGGIGGSTSSGPLGAVGPPPHCTQMRQTTIPAIRATVKT